MLTQSIRRNNKLATVQGLIVALYREMDVYGGIYLEFISDFVADSHKAALKMAYQFVGTK